MIRDWNEEVARSIIELEQLKTGILKSNSQTEFERQIEVTIEKAYQVLNKLVSKRTELFSIVQRNIQHLRELKENSFLPGSNGQFDALRYQASMALGVLQFTFWEKSNQELYELLDRVHHRA